MSMEQEHQSALRGKIDLRAILRLESGLHIGGASEFAPIGAVDSPFIRDPLTKKPIIPGSTIKGAMRTAILWRYLREHPEQARHYWNGMCGLTRADRNSRRAQQAQTREMEQDILHVLGANAKKRADAVNSAMRGLRVSDAVTEARGTIILQKIDESTQLGRLQQSEKRLPLFRECIPAGTKLRFSMTADFSMLAKIGVTSFADIVEALRAYTQDALRWQESAFGKKDAHLFREADTADVLLGGGTGFLSKTLVRALAQHLADVPHADVLQAGRTVRPIPGRAAHPAEPLAALECLLSGNPAGRGGPGR
ncbi:type III-A CRISPR-associated RAMP protein Csm5 [Mitsuokella multacida]|uniref:type III-A CRISPR-associated RAMP protein Csm5 n=1 Tax=Mitsuokella multacida TaxID=52226 RepID=UPI003F7E6FA6